MLLNLRFAHRSKVDCCAVNRCEIKCTATAATGLRDSEATVSRAGSDAGGKRRELSDRGRGPSGEELAIDIAAFGPTDADRLLVISSGLHGVECPFGSAVQQQLMRRWGGDHPPANVRCLLIHALNPFGFAWSRRWDDQNIDQNRNFLIRGEAYSGSDPMYGRLDALLDPKRPPSRRDMFLVRAAGALVRHGTASLKQAIAAGQYDYPEAFFTVVADRPRRRRS